MVKHQKYIDKWINEDSHSLSDKSSNDTSPDPQQNDNSEN